jgi:hypothetical protein
MLDAKIYVTDGIEEYGEYVIEYYDRDLEEWTIDSQYSLDEFTPAMQFAQDLADDLRWPTRIILSKHVQTVWSNFTPC